MEKEDKLKFLAQSIADAKKVMHKVETMDTSNIQEKYTSQSKPKVDVNRNKTMKNASTSKMPKEILESFMDNPITDPTIYDMNALASEVNEFSQPVKKPIINEQVDQPLTNQNIDYKFIEYIIKKTVEETIEQITKNTSINENFQIKIDEKVFSGKLTNLKQYTKTKKNE